MSEKGILTKAIEKAKSNGFWQLGKFEVKSRYGFLRDKQKTVEEPYILEITGADDHFTREIAYQVVIFNHDFAKALFPGTITTKHTCNYPDCTDEYEEVPAWKYHLQAMVVSQDPLKYLEKHS